MTKFETQLNNRKEREQKAVAVLGLISQLQQRQVNLTWFGKTLSTDINAILALHDKSDSSLDPTQEWLKSLIDADVRVANIDVGIALRDHKTAKDLKGAGVATAKDVVLFGFGRIGRILARLLLARPASDMGLQLKAIVVRPADANDLAKRASLLERDSVHGWFDGSVIVDNDNQGLIVNGRFVQVIYAADPSQIDYNSYGIHNALLIDNTGKFKDKAGLGKHLAATGVDKVLLTAPAKDGIKNIVFGVNDNTIGDDTIVSAASCTTNAITPILKLLYDEYGIDNGHMETIHAFTNDQNLVDNHHKADRRGRAAPLNMVMTSTGAATAVSLAIPELKGKLTGNAIRVPTPNVSLAILNLNLDRSANTAQDLNAFIKKHADSVQWQDQLAYSDSSEAVSSDFIGYKQVAIFDAKATLVEGKRATLYLWYDNEMGYSTQVLRVAEAMAGIDYQRLG